MASMSILYWSQSRTIGATARAIAGAAADEGAEVYLIDATDMKEADWAQLAASDAIVFGTPTYMGGIAAGFKAVLEETGHNIWTGRDWVDKLAGGFTCGIQQAGDKLATLKSLAIFAAQHGMIWVGQEAIGAPVFPDREGINSSGTFLGLTVGQAEGGRLDAGSEASARLFGTRMARALARWSRD